MRLKDGTAGYIIILLEHKSAPDKWVALQILGYQVLLWARLQEEGAKALLKAVEAKTVPSTALSPFLVRQLTAFDDAEIAALIKSAWGDVNAPKADMAERVKKYRDLLTPAALAKVKTWGRTSRAAIAPI